MGFSPPLLRGGSEKRNMEGKEEQKMRARNRAKKGKPRRGSPEREVKKPRTKGRDERPIEGWVRRP